MEADRKRNISSGRSYDHLFPRANMRETTVKRGAIVEDTVRFIPKAVQMTRWQTRAYTDQELKGLSVYDACKKLWHFVYEHIAYQKDEEGLEQIRSPGRTWHDRFSGVDCDCYTTFISTVLTNLNIPHALRIAKYPGGYRFQHIYPIVPLANGDYITIDCVLNRFNYEQPYSEKKDTYMDLQFLDGVADDADDPVDMDSVYGDLGWPKWMKKIPKPPVNKIIKKLPKPPGLSKAVDAAHRLKHLTNRFNPANMLLRNGVLAAMKVNMFFIPEGLRWSYLNEDDARKRGIDMGKYAQMKKIREKLEFLFYGAGGEPENLKKAILTGNGNKDRAVNGIDGLGEIDIAGIGEVNEDTSLLQLLGPEMWYAENVAGVTDLEGLEGVHRLDDMEGLYDNEYAARDAGLGEAAAISIAAVTALLGGIAALVKSVGNLFPKKGGQAAAPDKYAEASSDSGGDETPSVSMPAVNADSSAPAPAQEQDTGVANPEGSASAAEETNIPPAAEHAEADPGSNTSDESLSLALKPPSPLKTTSLSGPKANFIPSVGFWEQHKKWLKPALIGLGGITAAYIGYRMVSGSKTKKRPASKKNDGLSGLKSRKKSKGKKAQRRRIHPLVLM